MREIKFRNWDGFQMHYELYADHGIDANIEINEELNRTKNLMQFTGLLDKNEKEIYEDDIVLVTKTFSGSAKKDMNLIIKYSNVGARFVLENPRPSDKDIEKRYQELVHGININYWTAKNKLEVIGNIHENKLDSQ